MKQLLRTMIVLSSICLSRANAAYAQSVVQPLAQPSAKPQAVAAVKGQPFPFSAGMALEQRLYDTIKRKLQAADQLRERSEQAIEGLNQELEAHQTLLREMQAETGYLDERQRTLQDQIGSLTAERDRYQDQLSQAQRVLEAARAALPGRFRRRATSIDELARLVAEQLEKAQKAPLRYGVGGVVLGIILTLIVLL